MKKLLLVLVLGGALLFPIVGLADTEGEAEAVLTLAAVIDVTVVDGLGDLTVYQSHADGDPNLEDLMAATIAAGLSEIWVAFPDTFRIDLVALTKFSVNLDWSFQVNGGAGTLGDTTKVLKLVAPGPAELSLPAPGTGFCLDDYFSNVNNTPGEQVEFGLMVNLDELGDRAINDDITFVLTVTITDTT